MEGVPFSEILAQRANASSAIKHKRTDRTLDDRDPKKMHQQKNSSNVSKKKKKKNEPAVLSTKVPISKKRMVVAVAPKRQVRDPRFDSLSGKLDIGTFDKTYEFVDEYRKEEIGELEELLKETVDQEDREAIVAELRALKHQDRVLNQKKDQYELGVRVKQKKRKIMEDSGRNMKLNKKKVKQIEAEERYKMLEEKNKLDKYLGKKRKKLQQKNKKTIPVSKK